MPRPQCLRYCRRKAYAHAIYADDTDIAIDFMIFFIFITFIHYAVQVYRPRPGHGRHAASALAGRSYRLYFTGNSLKNDFHFLALV